MTTSLEGRTAKIYQFPKRERLIAAERREAARVAAEVVSVRVCSVAGEAWYHEEAIREAERTPKQ